MCGAQEVVISEEGMEYVQGLISEACYSTTKHTILTVIIEQQQLRTNKFALAIGKLNIVYLQDSTLGDVDVTSLT